MRTEDRSARRSSATSTGPAHGPVGGRSETSPEPGPVAGPADHPAPQAETARSAAARPESPARPGPLGRRPHLRWLAALAIGGLAALWLTSGPVWFLTLFANLAHVVGLVLVLALPLTLIGRRGTCAAFQIGFALMLAGILGVRWGRAPEAGAPVGDGARCDLRTVTYNLGCGLVDGDALVRALGQLDADLIALQELSVANADLLADALRDSHPHRVLLPGGIPGRGLLSRHPIVAHEYLDLSQSRRHLLCRLDVEGRDVTVLVLHLGMTLGVVGERASGARDLAALLEHVQDDPCVIVCGDFNTTENSAVWRRMRRAGFVDAFRASARGPGFTFPVGGRYHDLPAPQSVRIDYVWTTPQLVPQAARIGPDCGSDHAPVIADLNWAEQP